MKIEVTVVGHISDDMSRESPVGRERPTRILFVCHGNICRSPMAEFVLKDIVRRMKVSERFEIASCATSSEELGNPIYPPAARTLADHGIAYDRRCARRMTSDDYARYDRIYAMDRCNIRNMRPFVGGDPDGKVRLLMSCVGSDSDVQDPWYTGDFETAYADINSACVALAEEALGTSQHIDDGQ